VLVEKRNFKDSSLMKGRTRCWKNVLFPGNEELIGTLQRIKIHSYNHQTLIGNIS
jgi:tRNA-2-methylthio-N6-dimethylallyladenosine synthase